ncbi:FAD-binding oxidoreductase [Altererythrobacter sp. BO-6]|uniref:NAD(P)/FAD-dependent oxidoreductase n=1 Tax=Altererythrobacter sp. BO-6 TaxID=2604537 RepID=UPI0013E0EDAA|nr:FAD-dependent oxidoreductase [Altererythrobacter sp. BO-6]QIG55479.1 FAD-binding oxidoreductase [Altererythrobacter sp. BO-6]
MGHFDIAIVGAGMAGASIAAEIGNAAHTVILEAEDMPGYHSTGRSAAFWEECYGGPEIVPLTLASGPYLREHGFLKDRGALYLARAGDEAKIASFFASFADSGAEFERIDGEKLDRLVPGLSPEWDRAIWQQRCADIDVAGLHAHYLKRAKAAGASLHCRARVASLAFEGGRWEIGLGDGRSLLAALLVNAAGAWADHIAALAGVSPLGITPYRRTVAQLRVDPPPPDELPLCLDIAGSFYFKPESGRLWLSPHDETPSPPADVAPEELDVAIAIDRLQQVTDWRVLGVERKWAGLRSFAPDRRPVYGRDPANAAFFWFAGQGGYGIQTAPAAARLGAQLVLDRARDSMTATLDPQVYSPHRFRQI